MMNQIPVNYALFRVFAHNGCAQYMGFGRINILGDFIVTKLQGLNGVLRTQTNVIVD